MSVKAYKMTVYVVDVNNQFNGDTDEVMYAVEYGDADCLTITDIQVADIGEWEDNHPLNYGSKSPWDRYFK